MVALIIIIIIYNIKSNSHHHPCQLTWDFDYSILLLTIFDREGIFLSNLFITASTNNATEYPTNKKPRIIIGDDLSNSLLIKTDTSLNISILPTVPTVLNIPYIRPLMSLGMLLEKNLTRVTDKKFLVMVSKDHTAYENTEEGLSMYLNSSRMHPFIKKVIGKEILTGILSIKVPKTNRNRSPNASLTISMLENRWLP